VSEDRTSQKFFDSGEVTILRVDWMFVAPVDVMVEGRVLRLLTRKDKMTGVLAAYRRSAITLRWDRIQLRKFSTPYQMDYKHRLFINLIVKYRA